MSLEVLRVLSEMKSGTHAVLIYDSPENKTEILMCHMRLGMKDSKLAYVCADDSPVDVEHQMKMRGLDVEKLKAGDRLTIESYDEVFVKDGRFDASAAIGYFSYLAMGSLREGLEGGVRVASEMSGFFRAGGIEALETFERRLHRTFSFPATGLWAYGLEDLSGSGRLESFFQLLHQQNPVIFSGPNGSTVLMPDSPKEVAQVIQLAR